MHYNNNLLTVQYYIIYNWFFDNLCFALHISYRKMKNNTISDLIKGMQYYKFEFS